MNSSIFYHAQVISSSRASFTHLHVFTSKHLLRLFLWDEIYLYNSTSIPSHKALLSCKSLHISRDIHAVFSMSCNKWCPLGLWMISWEHFGPLNPAFLTFSHSVQHYCLLCTCSILHTLVPEKDLSPAKNVAEVISQK